MAKQARSSHPCDVRDALEPWKADHLYIGDDGEVLCGRCMGVESTYRPWCWSDLGRMDADRSVTRPPEYIDVAPGRSELVPSTAYRCETDRYAAPSIH